jgi:hypothetical protein
MSVYRSGSYVGQTRVGPPHAGGPHQDRLIAPVELTPQAAAALVLLLAAIERQRQRLAQGAES